MLTEISLVRFELALLCALAFVLIALPTITVRILGLPGGATNFWPRLVGGLLVGLVIATLASAQGWTRSGMGLGGLIAVNLTIAFTIASQLVVGSSIATKRARVILWLLVAALAALAFVQIAYAT